MIGEKIAQDYLQKKGYKILKTNYYTIRGEIDIIAQYNKCIIFVEVKTRTNNHYGTPAMAVNFNKKQHIKTSAKIFLQLEHLYGKEIRFDVIEILIKNGNYYINHIKSIM